MESKQTQYLLQLYFPLSLVMFQAGNTLSCLLVKALQEIHLLQTIGLTLRAQVLHVLKVSLLISLHPIVLGD